MKYKILSGNMLKIIAAIAMLFDHIGVIFFPSVLVFRMIGRLALPIFAFMISEGAKYTRNKKRHFLMMFGLAVICQIVYFIFDNGSLYMSILVTFSISTLLIYILQGFKKVLFSKNKDTLDKWIWGLFFGASVIGVYLLNEVLTIDYGFMGCIAPVLASLFDFKDLEVPENLKKLDNNTVRVLCLLPALIGLIIRNVIPVQYFSLLSIPLLLLYSGERGTHKLKYFFYIFYPLHLAMLEGIYILIHILK